ncbi:hypothetical protein [Pelomonas sp. Root1217]|uniref:hypothetical protein n=1 Tax=Pelomonas sp. Root1217 TaxID=1736430 RepID=UPI0012F75B7F|nr:hypothetical protein [Pelomonas sp. Root1217]
MKKRRSVGMILFSAPIFLWSTVEFSKYEWIWNRTQYSIVAGTIAALLSFIVMTLGLYFFYGSHQKIAGRTVLLGAAILTIQLFNIGTDGFAQMSKTESIGDGSEAFALRYAALGSSWTDLYVTRAKWLILRETDHIHQYSSPTVTQLQRNANGILEVHLTEYGKPDRVDRYSPSDLQNKQHSR